MKKIISVLALLFIFTACSNADDAKILAETYRQASGINIDAEIKAEFSDRSDIYCVSYSYERGNDATVKVTSPATIAGIEGIIDEESAVLRFEDTVLETGMDLSTPTPLNVIHKLIRVWSFNEVSQMGNEGDLLLLVFEEGEYEYRTLFTKEYIPVSAEIVFESNVKMKIDFIKCEGVTYDN